MEPLLTVAEVAQAARVSKMTIYRMIHLGALPAMRVGRSFRVPRAAVRELLSAGSRADTPSADTDAPDDPGRQLVDAVNALQAVGTPIRT